MEIEMTALPKTWILDLDGTLVKHNGYKIDGKDTLLDGADGILKQIRDIDMVIIVTSRTKEFKAITETFLYENKIRFDHIIYEVPYGERILINDRKPSGRTMAFAINADRNVAADIIINVDNNL